MSFALIIIGIALLVTSVKNTQTDLFTLLKGDFTGSSNFIFWMVAIFAIGALGYVKTLRPLSTALMVLVIIVLIIARGNPGSVGGGIFQQLETALNSTTKANTTPTATGGGLSSLIPSLPSLPNLGE